jgi:1,4-alpha-glucan branching enzyme
VRELNRFYRSQPARFEVDFQYNGFEWIDFRDIDNSIILFLRWSEGRKEFLVFACNFTPVPRAGYRVGVPKAGFYREVFNTDAEMFGGSNLGNGLYPIHTDAVAFHGHGQSLRITLPPLGVSIFKLVAEASLSG